jgi:hypothetical protein
MDAGKILPPGDASTLLQRYAPAQKVRERRIPDKKRPTTGSG